MEPAAGHASDFIQAPVGKEQLLLADPVALLHQAPEDAQLFEQQVQLAQVPGFLRAGRIDGPRHQQQCVQCQVVQALAKGEPRAFGQAGGAVERPTEPFGGRGVNRWFVPAEPANERSGVPASAACVLKLPPACGSVSLGGMKAANRMEGPVDFVIITALEEERSSVLAKLPNCQPLPPEPQDIRQYYAGRLPVTLAGGAQGHYSVVVMQLLGMGRLQAATTTSDAIKRWRPRYVLMVGIAGGVAAKGASLGDILVSQQIVDYELQKLTPAGPQIRWQVHQADPRLLGASQRVPAEAARSLLTARRPLKGTP